MILCGKEQKLSTHSCLLDIDRQDSLTHPHWCGEVALDQSQSLEKPTQSRRPPSMFPLSTLRPCIPTHILITTTGR